MAFPTLLPGNLILRLGTSDVYSIPVGTVLEADDDDIQVVVYKANDTTWTMTGLPDEIPNERLARMGKRWIVVRWGAVHSDGLVRVEEMLKREDRRIGDPLIPISQIRAAINDQPWPAEDGD